LDGSVSRGRFLSEEFPNSTSKTEKTKERPFQRTEKILISCKTVQLS
jgi:hypothetical protein